MKIPENHRKTEAIIPAYPVSYDNSSTDPAKRAVIAGVINDVNVLSKNSLFTDNEDVSVHTLYHPDIMVSTSSGGSLERIKQSGVLFGDGEDDIVEGFSFANGDNDNNMKSYYMRYADASYQFCFNDGYNYARLDMRYEHTLTDIEVDYLNKAVFSPESVKIKAMKSDYKIHNIHDIQLTENEFYRLDIQGKNASELELIYENGYWVLSSDAPLGMLQITGTNSYGTSEKLLSTSAGKIKIFAENELSVGIMTDDDNDNIFETYLTDNVAKGDVNEDGIIDATDASEVLAEYASISTGNNRSFSDEQFESADIDYDGIISATDASFILSFFSYISTGGAETNMIKWILNS